MVDKYLVFDDGLYAKNKWAYRNRILINGAPGYFRTTLLKANPAQKFNEIRISNDIKEKNRKIRTLDLAYRKAPHYSEVMPMLEQFLMADYDNLSEYNVASNRLVCDYLDIKTEVFLSSELDTDKTLKKQYSIFNECRVLGGMELYDFEEFRENGIELAFLKTDDITYSQFSGEFVPDLSIIDVMMFNSVPEIQDMLNRYTLIKS